MRPIFVFTLFSACTVSGCRTKADFYRISDAELARIEKAADEGDITSATRLVHHWLISQNNIELGKKWMLRAAELGDQVSCKNLVGLGVTEFPVACQIPEAAE